MSKKDANEDEYFVRLEFKKRKQQEEQKQKELKTEERQNLKELHYMKCPKCGLQLIEIDYKDIKIDKCSECDGVWLDAGELESIIGLEKTNLDKLFSVFRK